MAHSAPAAVSGLFSRLRAALPGGTPRRAVASMHQKSGAYSAYGASFTQGTLVVTPGKPVWSGRDYTRFADEAYIRNVIAHRAIHTIATAAASVEWTLSTLPSPRGGARQIAQHPMLSLLNRPNPSQGGAELFESLFASRLISGNAYLQAVGPQGQPPRELYSLRPDRVQVVAGRSMLPSGYRYVVRDASGTERFTDFPVDPITGRSRVLHFKHFHPLNDWYGLSPIEAAAYSIDQHNQAGAWNQSLLQNGARPTGALIVKGIEGVGATLSDEQFSRLKRQMDEQYSGAANAGRPLLLEGGLEWKEMSLSPRDMDFINAKHSAARDIALALGVPPQLLGIPGDNTYSNLAEARLALWEQTILPLLDHLCDALNNWLVPQFGGGLKLACDLDSVSALSPKREALWARVSAANFLSDQEKRELLGIGKMMKNAQC